MRNVPTIVWPDNPLTKNGGLYPHVIKDSVVVAGPSLIEYMRHQRMPIQLNWNDLQFLTQTEDYQKILGCDWYTEEHLSWVPGFCIRRSLDFTVGDNTGQPLWQQIKVAFHACPIRMSEDKPRMTCSAVYFLKKYYGIELTDDMTKELYGKITGDLSWKYKDYTFKLHHGDAPDAAEVITRVYTNVPPVGSITNPSVLGSCMRRERWSSQWGTIGIGGDFPHPASVYAVAPLGIAWLENTVGKTVARTLVNLKTKMFHRVYSYAPGGMDSSGAAHREAQNLEDYFRHLLVQEGFTSSYDTLLGVKLKIHRIPGTDLCVAPYLDCDYQSVDPDTLEVSDGGYLWTNHNPPVQQCAGEIIECADCGAQLLPHEVHEGSDGEYYCEDHLVENTTICCHCGEVINMDNDSYYTYGDGHLCYSCYDNYYFTCEDCDEIYPNDDLHCADGRSYCESCFDSMYVYCDECGEPVERNMVCGTPDCDTLCESCFDNAWYRCDECSTVVPLDDVVDGLCPDCQPKEQTNEC